MWVLLFLMLTAGGSLDYYHIGTYLTEKECGSELGKARVLVTAKTQTINCIWIDIPNEED